METRAEAIAASAELCPCVNKVSSSFPGSWENGENGQVGGKLQGHCCWSDFRAPAGGGGKVLILQLTRVGGLVAANGQQALPAEVTTQASFGKQPQRVNTEAPQLAPGPSLRNVPASLSARVAHLILSQRAFLPLFVGH